MGKERTGLYIAFEGVVGCGKTTQSRLLVTKLIAEFPNREVIWEREPGGSEIADAIRKIVLVPPFEEEMDPVCEQYLFAASRAQTLRTVVRPVLEKGGVVVSDRSIFSSLAYQGFGRELGINRVLAINRQAVDDLWPDKVYFIDLPVRTALSRTRDKSGDKFESNGEEFYERVREGYLVLAAKAPRLVEVVDGSGEIEKVHNRIHASVLKLLDDKRSSSS